MAPLASTGNYNGSTGHYNIFQGYQNGVNTIAWNGVPIDAPGTAGTRVIRITNVRANAFQLGVSSTLIPTQISMIVAVSGSTIISINQPGNGNVVGNIQPGLTGSSTSATYQQCNNLNASLLDSVGGQTGTIYCDGEGGLCGFVQAAELRQYYDVTTNMAVVHKLRVTSLQGRLACRISPGSPTILNRASITNATGLDQSED